MISDSHKLTVEVEIDQEYCVVSNNIKEKLAKDSTGIGLTNLRERYKYLSDKKIILLNNESKFEVKIPILEFEANLNTKTDEWNTS